MEPLRFVHAADLHIDSPFRGIGQVNSTVGQRLRESTYEAYRNLVRLCLDEKVDFLVIAGDVYDGADRSIRAQIRFRDGLRELADAGIQTFVVHGNHDPLDGWQPSVEWPQLVAIFHAEVEWRQATRDGRPIAQVAGVSYPTREVTENLSRRFTPPPDSDLFSIGLLHCNLGGNAAHDNYAPCTVDDLKAAGIDYWALGHVHTRDLIQSASVTIAYPGNSQGRHPNESGARGCYLVDVAADGRASPEFRPLDVVRWERIEISIAEIATFDELASAAGRALRETQETAGGRDVVCRIVLTGRGPLHDEVVRGDAVEALLDVLRPADAPVSPWIWVERIADRTRPDLDLGQAETQDDFLANCLRRAKELQPDEIETLLAEVYSGRRDRLPKPSNAGLATGDLVDEARWYLAELLRRES